VDYNRSTKLGLGYTVNPQGISSWFTWENKTLTVFKDRLEKKFGKRFQNSARVFLSLFSLGPFGTLQSGSEAGEGGGQKVPLSLTTPESIKAIRAKLKVVKRVKKSPKNVSFEVRNMSL